MNFSKALAAEMFCGFQTTISDIFFSGQRIIEAPFEVRPAMFYAPKGSTIPLEVLFLPKKLGEFSLDVLFVCDNCNVRKVGA